MVIGGGQLRSDDGYSAIYIHKVITLDPAADCPSSRVSEVIVISMMMMPFVSWQTAVMFFTYEFENVDADGLDAVIKDDQLPHKEQTCFAFTKPYFEKTSFSQG